MMLPGGSKEEEIFIFGLQSLDFIKVQLNSFGKGEAELYLESMFCILRFNKKFLNFEIVSIAILIYKNYTNSCYSAI